MELGSPPRRPAAGSGAASRSGSAPRPRRGPGWGRPRAGPTGRGGAAAPAKPLPSRLVVVSLPPKRMSRYIATSSSSVIASLSRWSSSSRASSGPSPVVRRWWIISPTYCAEGVDGLVGLAQRRLVEAEQRADRLGPLPDHVPVGLRDPDEVDDDAHGELVGEVALDVTVSGFSTICVDEVVDVPLDRLAQHLDAPGGERPRRDAAQPRVPGRVVPAHEVALEVEDLEEDLVLRGRQPAHRPLGQLAEAVGVLADRVCAAHHRLDVARGG